MRHKGLCMVAVVGCVLGQLAMVGCSQRILDFTVVSSKNTEMQVPTAAKGDRVEGADTVPIILFPLGTPSLKEAIDRAIESAGPEYDALIDGVLWYKFFYFLFGIAEYKVEGTPVISSQINMASTGDDMGDLAAAKPLLYHSRMDQSNDTAIAELGLREMK